MTVKSIGKTIVLVLLSSLLVVGSNLALAADAPSDSDTSDIMAMLTEALKLTPDQAGKLKPEIDTFVHTIDRLKADQEKEDADPEALVKGAKKAQEDYQKALKKILTPQ